MTKRGTWFGVYQDGKRRSLHARRQSAKLIMQAQHRDNEAIAKILKIRNDRQLQIKKLKVRCS